MTSAAAGAALAFFASCTYMAVSPAHSFDDFTAGQLASACEGWRHALIDGDRVKNVTGEQIAGGQCQGFMLDVVQANSAPVEGKELRFCPPEGLTTMQAIRTVPNLADDSPEDLYVPAYLVVERAMLIAHPCPE